MERKHCDRIDIDGLPALDTIQAWPEDIGPGQGRMTIRCWGQAWTGYWGAMGERTLRQFFVQSPAEYLAGAMARSDSKKPALAYLTRVVEAVQQAILGVTQEGEE